MKTHVMMLYRPLCAPLGNRLFWRKQPDTAMRTLVKALATAAVVIAIASSSEGNRGHQTP